MLTTIHKVITAFKRIPFLFLATFLFFSTEGRATNVTFEWDPVTLNTDGSAITDLAGYRLFYRSSTLAPGGVYMSAAQAMADSSVTKVDVPTSSTSHTLDLTEGSTYYFRVTAYNSSGNQSEFNLDSNSQNIEISNYITPQLSQTPELEEAFSFPNPVTKGQHPVIRAHLGAVDEVQITLFDQAGEQVHSVVLNGTPSGTQNNKEYYDYQWTGAKASGIYYAVINGKRGDEIVHARAELTIVK